MPRRTHTSVALAAALSLSVVTADASAADDGAYGRLDGDVALSGEATLVVGGDGAALGARASAAYLTMAGVYAEFAEGLATDDRPLRRRVSGGVHLHPLFLARFVNHLERGPAVFDLWLDSLGVGVGSFVAWRDVPGCLSGCRTEGLEVAGEMALPLVPRGSGPFVGLRGGARWSLSGDPAARWDGALGFVALSLGYRAMVSAGSLGAGQ